MHRRILSGLFCLIFVSAHVVAVSGLVGFIGLQGYNGGWTGQCSNSTPSVWEALEWTNVGEGQTRLLYKDYEQVHGHPYIPRDQGQTPSCVGQSVAAAVDFLAAVEIRAGEPERAPPAGASAHVIYGLSRVEIGGLRPDSGAGSWNLWGALAVTEYGAVAKVNYNLLGYDLQNDEWYGDKFARNGIPIGLEFIAKIHPVKDYFAVKTYAECRDAIYMGCPIIVGSSQGFGNGQLYRDRDGFLNPPRFFYSPWNHSMAIIGMCDTGRKGCLILNSWGGEGPNGWINGPKRFGDEPEGSFWVDADIIEYMMSQGDSFALRGFKGYSNYRLWKPK